MKETKKNGLPLRAACVLLCLVLISAHFTSGLYARFIVNVSGTDRARTASFRVDAEMNGSGGDYTISFSNDSETAVRYSVLVQPKMPGMFLEISLNGNDSPAPDGSGAYVFADVDRLAPGANGSVALRLTVDPAFAAAEAVSSLEDFSNDSTSTAEAELPFTVTVRFVQVD